MATVTLVAAARADILALQGLDFDAGGVALDALAERMAAAGLDYPHRLTLRPNTGRDTGLDLDGDGRLGGARDAQGYGWFNGRGGMAVLSRYPIVAVTDHSAVLWADQPGSAAPRVVPAAALSILRLFDVGAWTLTIETDVGPLTLLTVHAAAPVFDGPEDRNGWRNADQLRFLTGQVEALAPSGAAFALIGTLNVDPGRGEGHRDRLAALIAHPALQDPRPTTADGRLETADWAEPDPGNLRVDYILPSAALTVLGSGVIWPTDGPLAAAAEAASDHRLVWLDLALP